MKPPNIPHQRSGSGENAALSGKGVRTTGGPAKSVGERPSDCVIKGERMKRPAVLEAVKKLTVVKTTPYRDRPGGIARVRVPRNSREIEASWQVSPDRTLGAVDIEGHAGRAAR